MKKIIIISCVLVAVVASLMNTGKETGTQIKEINNNRYAQLAQL